MKIRAATIADVPALFELRCGVRENRLTEEQLAAHGITQATVAAMIEGGDYIVPVVETDRGIVAFAMGEVSRGYVFAVFVRDGFEGLGFGRAVTEAMEEGLRRRGTQRAWLTTDSNPTCRAHGFYRRLGWIDCGKAENGETRYEKVLVPL